MELLLCHLKYMFSIKQPFVKHYYNLCVKFACEITRLLSKVYFLSWNVEKSFRSYCCSEKNLTSQVKN